MRNELTNRKIIRQAPAMVNGKFSLSKSESDMFLLIMAQVKKEDTEFKVYEFTKKEFEAKIGAEISHKRLHEVVKSLHEKSFEIYENERKWKVFSLIDVSEYDNEIVKIQMSKSIKPYILELKRFVLGDLSEVLKIKSSYARRIYFMLKENLGIGESRTSERTFDIQELMNILEVPKSYTIYNRFKMKIIEQSIKEINTHTDIKIIDLEEHKFKRKVEEITFYYEAKRNKTYKDIDYKESLKSLKTFIVWCRKNRINKAVGTKDGAEIKVSSKGLLYNGTTLEELDRIEALKAWENLYNFEKNKK